MAELSASLTGTLQLTPPPQSTVEQGRSSGASFGVSLRGANGSPKNEISQQCVVTTSGSFTSLPFPSNLRGRVLYLRMTEQSGPASVRLTQEVTGVTTIVGVQGLLLMEFVATDRLTLVEVDGDCTFEWACFGDNA